MRIKFSKEVTTPAVCRDGDDFVKFMASFVILLRSTESSMPPEVFISGLKYLLHEYLALTLQGKIEPYRAFPDKEMAELFQAAMLSTTEMMMPGVPMKEEDGRTKIDIEAILKKHGKDLGNSLMGRKDGKS